MIPELQKEWDLLREGTGDEFLFDWRSSEVEINGVVVGNDYLACVDRYNPVSKRRKGPFSHMETGYDPWMYGSGFNSIVSAEEDLAKKLRQKREEVEAAGRPWPPKRETK